MGRHRRMTWSTILLLFLAVGLLCFCGLSSLTDYLRGYRSLREAVIGGNLERVRACVRDGESVSTVYDGGLTPLHLAAVYGHESVADFLLRRVDDVDATSDYGQSPLHEAAHGGSPEIVELLLKASADVKKKDKQGKTPLHEAASRGHSFVVRVLLEAGADMQAKDRSGRTVLGHAVLSGSGQTVRLLLERGAVPGSYRADKEYLIVMASKRGYAGVTEALIAAGESAGSLLGRVGVAALTPWTGSARWAILPMRSKPRNPEVPLMVWKARKTLWIGSDCSGSLSRSNKAPSAVWI